MVLLLKNLQLVHNSDVVEEIETSSASNTGGATLSASSSSDVAKSPKLMGSYLDYLSN